MKREGRPEKIRSEGLCVLRELALKPAPATLDELVKAFQIRSGLQVHSAPLRKPLASLGVVRVKPSRPPSTTTGDQTSKRYGYQDRHRPLNQLNTTQFADRHGMELGALIQCYLECEATSLILRLPFSMRQYVKRYFLPIVVLPAFVFAEVGVRFFLLPA